MSRRHRKRSIAYGCCSSKPSTQRIGTAGPIIVVALPRVRWLHRQLIPWPPVPAWARRADRLSDLANKLISQLACPAVAGQARLCRSLDIPPGGLAVHPGLLSHPPQPGTR